MIIENMRRPGTDPLSIPNKRYDHEGKIFDKAPENSYEEAFIYTICFYFTSYLFLCHFAFTSSLQYSLLHYEFLVPNLIKSIGNI